MDLALEPHEEAFRDELLRWLAEAPRPDGLRDYGATPTAEDIGPARAWQRRLYDGGWAGLSWPVEYGGRGASVVEEAIFAEETARAGVPRQLNFTGFELAGPMLIEFGTDAQRERYLGPLLRGDEIWCQLFSEPNAGSDLAALTTRAVRSGDGWRVSGQKVWTSGAQYSDHGLLLARTGDQPRHRGITCFLMPLDRDGVDVRPLKQMDAEAKFNEVFLDGVSVRDDEILGKVDEGWTVAISTLGRERRTLGAQAIGYLRGLGELREEIVSRGADARQRDAWTRAYARVHALRLSWLRELSAGSQGSEPRMSILKLASSELQRDLTCLAADVLDADLLIGADPSGWRQRYLGAPGATLAGGTSEIQRNILAERVLGLPRGAR